jgi:hypothetical protein
MNTYQAILRSDNEIKEITLQANDCVIAWTEAMDHAARLKRETGVDWYVGRCNSDKASEA